MTRYVIGRILMMVPILFFVSLVTYALLLFVPGDPAATLAGEGASPQTIEAIRERIGLDNPFIVQYFDWLRGAVVGDFGDSLFGRGSVSSSIWRRLPVTLSLGAFGMAIALIIAVPAGLVAAINRGRWIDRFTTIASTVGVALPSFWLGLIVIQLFAVDRRWFPALSYSPLDEGVWQWARHLILPGLTLGTAIAAETTRQLRSSMIDVMQQDYVRTAEAKGLSAVQVIIKHAMTNAAIPVLTVMGFQVAYLLGGAIIVEEIFALPGLGQLTIRAVIERDIPVIQGVVVFSAVVVMVVNLVVDITYRLLNPKVRVEA